MDVEEEEVKKDETVKVAKPADTGKDSDFLAFDEFVDDLGSWKPLLKKFIEGKKFRSTYDFIKGEYATKTVLKL